MIDSPHDVLRKARIAKGFSSAAEAARYFGWKESTYVSHENGTRGIRKDAAKKYARAFGIGVAALLDLRPETAAATSEVLVVGTAAFGVWRDKSLDEEHNKNKVSLSIPNVGAEERMKYAVFVEDDSVNKAINKGEYAIFLPSETVLDGKFFYVERKRGDLIERSIRRAITRKGKVVLSTWSNSAKYSDELPSDSPDVKIIGQIVGKYAALG